MSDIEFVILKGDSEIERHVISIYEDDTIENVKNKLSLSITVKNVEHYYLFYKKNEVLNPYDIYKKLTLNDTKSINYKMFHSFCLNHGIKNDEKKDIYELEDLLKLNLEVETSIAIGIENNSPFVVNPYENPFNNIEDSSTESKTLWMSYSELKDRVYVCLATDVFEYVKEKSLEVNQTLNVYFPYLCSQGKLKELNPDIDNSSKYDNYNNLIEFHHNIYKKADINQGITSIFFVLYTLQPFKFPIEIFFKLIQTRLEYPFIKLNGTKKQDNIYRLYCDKYSENGNKIPFLKKKTILKYGNEQKTPNSITYLFYNENPLIMTIDKNGHIYFKLEKLNMFTVEDVEKLIKTTTTMVLNKLIEFFDPSEKIFSHFNSLHHDNVDIIDLNYKMIFKKAGKLDIKNKIECFSPIFNYIDDKGPTLRYKRVSNFNTLESMDSYITEAINHLVPFNEMVHIFSVNFMKNDTDKATEYIHSFLESVKLDQDVKINRIRKLKISPGFLVNVEKGDKTVEVTVQSIDNIKYIKFIELYVTNLISISQGLVSDEGCKKVEEINIVEVKHVNDAPGFLDEFVLLDKSDEVDIDFQKDISEMPDEELTPELDIGLSEKEPELDELALSENKPELDDLALSENTPALNLDLDEPEIKAPSFSASNVALNDEPDVLSEKAEAEEDEEGESEAAEEEAAEEEADEEEEEEADEEEEQEAEDEGEFVLKNDEDLDLDLSESPSNLSSSNLDLDESPVQSGGGMMDVFIYDENHPEYLTKLFKQTLNLYPAEITDYFRAFNGSECTLVKTPGSKCKGYVVTLTDEQTKRIYEDLVNVMVYDKAGNEKNVRTHIKTLDEWTSDPSEAYLKKVYLTASFGWKNKLDDKDVLFIYDIKHNVKGKYNNIHYITTEDDADLTKIRFTPSNPFLKRLQEREPTLFFKSTDGKHSQYSRMCLWSSKRQPVILTKEEKDRIDKEAPGSYDNVIEYGTDSKNPFYYICPRFWDLKHNISVHPSKVKPENLISRDVPDSKKHLNIQTKYIVELSKPGKLPSYMTRVGFLSKQHPQGYYMPCCFTEKHNTEKKKQDVVEKRIEDAIKSYKQEAVEEREPEKQANYIQDGNKFPLDEGRKGHLTPLLGRFFQVSTADCYSNMQKRKLKLNYPCLLRKGVEKTKHQSFLGSISFLLNMDSIEDCKNKILKIVTIDTIQSFHNGNLSHTFSSKNYEDQDITPYKNSRLYKELRDSPEFKKIVSGYENFCNYIKSDQPIDYTYLWEIICMQLYKRRINMIVLYQESDDITQNISIVCPTTEHSIYSFDPQYPSIILYRKDDLFEPIYIYTETEKNFVQTKLFDIKTVNTRLINILEYIKVNMNKCKGQKSNRIYEFKENLTLEQLTDEIKKLKGYKIEKEIMHVDGRIIGVLVKEEDTFFVPCKPSASSENYKIVDDSIWNNYKTTVSSLERLYKQSSKRIPCKPVFRIIDDQMIVGILTETNQFIQLSEPEENKVKDDLKELNEHSYLDIDKEIAAHPFKKQKDKFIHYLKLEKSFYNAYFNTIKITINEISNISKRSSIEKIINSNEPFDTKLDKVRGILRPILDSKFIFTQYDDAILDELDDINICKSEEQPYCQFTNEGQLLIPINNLFNGSDNEILYENRFLDDLIMNVHVQRVIFEEIHSTIYYTDRYNLSDNEILLLESLINNYFDNNIPVKNIPSIVHRQFEDVQPSKIFEILNKSEETESDVSDAEIEEPNDSDYEESSDEEENEPDEPETNEEVNLNEPESEAEVNLNEVSEEEPEPLTNQEVKNNITKTKKLLEEYKQKPTKELNERLEEQIALTQNMAKELYKTTKTPETQELVVKTSAPTTKKIEKPGKDWEKCFVVVYLTKKWKLYFPKGTKTFRIQTDNITCNYYMIIQILKDYKMEYAEHTILDVKHMLIETYKKYDKFRQFILQKWEVEKPREHKLFTNSFEAIIMNETYPLTQVDVALLIYNYYIPITILNQSKENIKMIKGIKHSEDYSYYLKLQGSSQFMLFIYDKITYKIYDKDLDEEFIKKTYRTVFTTYLNSPDY